CQGTCSRSLCTRACAIHAERMCCVREPGAHGECRDDEREQRERDCPSRTYDLQRIPPVSWKADGYSTMGFDLIRLNDQSIGDLDEVEAPRRRRRPRLGARAAREERPELVGPELEHRPHERAHHVAEVAVGGDLK